MAEGLCIHVLADGGSERKLFVNALNESCRGYGGGGYAEGYRDDCGASSRVGGSGISNI